ncbi:shikimate dehydrogenase [Methanolacinia petrolearia]|uniref:shikimate dehydrogenase n=1 Tax=Methanolacinia petrolearia TaxID=54120 RepID=UPI003BAAAE79
MNKRIILTGFRGSGKTTVGEMLSERTGLPFYDTDEMVEAECRIPIPEIFSKEGEDAFRRAESKVIRELNLEPCIVSTGGGLILNPENVMNLRRDSLVFLLNVSPELAGMRISGSERPSLTGKSVGEEAAGLISRRMPYYRMASDFCIDAGLAPEEICDRIGGIMNYDPCTVEERTKAAGFFKNSPMSEEMRERTLSRIGLAGAVPFCAIAGNPCLHSKSPQLYSALFARYGIDSHYTYMQADDIRTIVEVMKTAGMKGLSVTIPFKEDVMECLDKTDIHSQRIGAVNTVLNSCGRLCGANTDWIGIREPLRDSKGKNAVVFGAGGAARAAVYALTDLGKDVTVINRTAERGMALAEHFGCSFSPPGDFKPDETEIVVNATSLGMGGKGSPLEEDQLRSHMTVFDLVYTPPETPLLKMAEKAGCNCIPGTEMFIYQVAEQFRQLFGIIPDTGEIREVLQR